MAVQDVPTTNPGPGPHKSRKVRNIVIALLALVVLVPAYTIYTGLHAIKKVGDQYAEPTASQPVVTIQLPRTDPSVAPSAPAEVVDVNGTPMPASLADRLAVFQQTVKYWEPEKVSLNNRDAADDVVAAWYASREDPRLLWGLVEDPTSPLAQFVAENGKWLISQWATLEDPTAGKGPDRTVQTPIELQNPRVGFKATLHLVHNAQGSIWLIRGLRNDDTGQVYGDMG